MTDKSSAALEECVEITRHITDQLTELVTYFAAEVGMKGIRATVDALLGDGTYDKFCTDEAYEERIQEISQKFTEDTVEYTQGFVRIISSAATVGILKAAYKTNSSIFGDKSDTINKRLRMMDHALNDALAKVKIGLIMDDEPKKKEEVDEKEK